MFTLIADHQITRRKRTHHVLDAEDVLLFTSPELRDCLDFLLEEGQHKFELNTHVGPKLYLTISLPTEDLTRCPGFPPEDPI